MDTRNLRIERKNSVSLKKIRRGAESSIDVVNECITLVKNTVFFDTDFNKFAVTRILLDNNLTTHSPMNERLQAVYNFVVNSVRYVSDAKDIEAIKDARTTLADGFGDCDDLAILIATLCGSIGINAQFALALIERAAKVRVPSTGAIVFKNVTPKDWNHIYIIVPYGKKYFALDANFKNPQFNSEAEGILQKKRISIFKENEIPALAGVGSFFKKIGKGLAKIAPIAVGFIPGVGALSAPLQGLINGATSAGFELLGNSKQGSAGGVVKGLAAITQYIAQVLAQLDEIKIQLPNLPPSQAVETAVKIAAQLSDSSIVYQPKKGKDAAALASGKTQAANKVEEIKQLAATVNIENNKNTVKESGINNRNDNNANGLDTNTLLIAGAAFVGFFLITRR